MATQVSTVVPRALFLVLMSCGALKVINTECMKKGMFLASLNMAKESIAKAKEYYPNQTNHRMILNQNGCETGEKSFGYLDVATSLITYALENYPTGDENERETYDLPMDCSQILENGHNKSGVYSIWLNSEHSTKRPVEVFCDMDTAGGGWTVIQRRGNFSVQEDFFRDWDAYKMGFGNVTRDFWIGNDYLFLLTQQGTYSIRFDLTDTKGVKGYAAYQTFRVESEASNYKLHIANYSGDIGDSMTKTHNGKQFSTRDRNNNVDCRLRDCPNEFKGGWWYGRGGGYCCYEANLNGLYQQATTLSARVTWITWRKYDRLNAVEMKLRRM